MSVIHIPATAEAAVEELGSLGRLINARKWERAAIVASLIGPPTGSGGDHTSGQSPILDFAFTPTTLAGEGVTGLRSKQTVIHYRDVWCRQRPAPALGDSVDLNGLPDWPGIPEEELAQRTGMTEERRKALLEAGKEAGMPTGAKVVDVAANPKAMAAAIMADPDTANAAVNALEERNRRDPRLAPSPETPEGKAMRAMLAARNNASRTIHQKVHEACVLLEEAQRSWEADFIDLAPREKAEVHSALHEIEVLAGTLRMNIALEEAE